MIDLIAEIIVVLAFVVSLFVVPAWATGLLFGKSSPEPAPSDYSDVDGRDDAERAAH